MNNQSKPVVFHFDRGLEKEAAEIMRGSYVGRAIAKVKDQLGDVLGYEVHLTRGTNKDLNGRQRADFDLNVYPLTEGALQEWQKWVTDGGKQ